MYAANFSSAWKKRSKFRSLGVLVCIFANMNDYLELAKRRLKRMRAVVSRITVTPKPELDKISLSDPSKHHSKKNLDCQF